MDYIRELNKKTQQEKPKIPAMKDIFYFTRYTKVPTKAGGGAGVRRSGK